MPDDLPRTDVDSYTPYQWQMTSAIRPCWTPYGNPHDPPPTAHPLRREAYIGRTCLAEPAHFDSDGPPYVILEHPEDGVQREVGFEFTKKDAARTVRRIDARAFSEDTPTLFDHA